MQTLVGFFCHMGSIAHMHGGLFMGTQDFLVARVGVVLAIARLSGTLGAFLGL